ncbi:MAG: GIY-YIG nuclease family protein [Patescibacteria group bacterium]
MFVLSMTSMSEIIYVLTNEAMPGYVKIGKTNNNLEQRVKDLSASTSVPLPFTVFYACSVKDANFVEHQLHDAFDNNRVNPRREFFQIAPERVVAALKLAELENITPNQDLIETNEDREAHNEALDRRGRFNFEIVKIPLGAEIYFSRDESKKAKVVDLHSSKSIEFNDQITSLSDSARILLGVNYGVAGTDYWMFEGETLDERRRRFESGE